jgi:hypothetical protein
MAADKKWFAHPALQLANLMADGAVRNMQMFSRHAKTAV